MSEYIGTVLSVYKKPSAQISSDLKLQVSTKLGVLLVVKCNET
jgi:hypothetical protein